MEPENSNQKLVTKYPAPKARKRDVAKTNRLGVAGNSIAEEIGNGIALQEDQNQSSMKI